jgi:soluble lytic murein transglycosylase
MKPLPLIKRFRRQMLATGSLQLRELLACLAVVCATLVGAAGVEDTLDVQRGEFRQAWSRQADAQFAADSASLQRYVLYPYLEAARMQQALLATGVVVPKPLDERIATFLRTHAGTPVAQTLRLSWLGSLAARAAWADFLAFHDPESDGIALRCQGFTARTELGTTAGLAPQVAETWLTPRSLQECDRAFAWLAETGGLTPALIEQRARNALEAGNADFARQISKRLPDELGAPLQQWAALIENPQREIEALIASPQKPVLSAALLAGWTRFARANRVGAKQRFEPLVRARHLDPLAASPLALALAMALSWDRDPDARRFFAKVETADFDDNAREWQSRAALWAHDWKLVSHSIAAMSEGNRRTARWRYWSARAQAHEGHRDTALQIYESLLAQDNYYSAMAAARLRRKITPTVLPLPPDTAFIARLENIPEFVRARELRASGLLDPARAEWRAGQNTLPAAARPQLIHLAARLGWYHQAVNIATGERVFNDYALLYPRPFDAEVAGAVALSGLPATLIYSVIRQESLYERDAISTADARGLTQLTPDTARRTARRWNLPLPATATLFEPAANVLLGAAHLKDMLNRFAGQLPLALAGYNAGPGAVQRWLPTVAMDPDIWLENVPYTETRAYVQRIAWHSVVYGWLATQKPQDTEGWLDAVKP